MVDPADGAKDDGGSPTCAGGDGNAVAVVRDGSPVHPRARGAMARKTVDRRRSAGSPTCAGGDGSVRWPVRVRSWVHPRARGAMAACTEPCQKLVRFTHVRGRRWRAGRSAAAAVAGSPTCAGGDGRCRLLRRASHQVHPRARGAMAQSRHVNHVSVSVHPRAREAMAFSPCTADVRFGSPTCAGGDGRCRLLRRASHQVHPRARGAMAQSRHVNHVSVSVHPRAREAMAFSPCTADVRFGSPTCAGGDGQAPRRK